jgi:hypothetical protein
MGFSWHWFVRREVAQTCTVLQSTRCQDSNIESSIHRVRWPRHRARNSCECCGLLDPTNAPKDDLNVVSSDEKREHRKAHHMCAHECPGRRRCCLVPLGTPQDTAQKLSFGIRNGFSVSRRPWRPSFVCANSPGRSMPPACIWSVHTQRYPLRLGPFYAIVGKVLNLQTI